MKNEETRRCSKCRRHLPFSSFTKNKTKKYGLDNWCRDCKKVINAENYKTVKPIELSDAELDRYTRQCTKCKQEKKLKYFNRKKDGVLGRNSRCRECTNQDNLLASTTQRAERDDTSVIDEIFNHGKVKRSRNVHHLPSELPNQTKHCLRCLRDVPVTEFSLKRGNRGGRADWCKDCYKSYYQSRKHLYKERYNNKEYHAERRQSKVIPSDASKVCKTCEREFGLEDFYKSKSGKWKRMNICKECWKARNREQGRVLRLKRRERLVACQKEGCKLFGRAGSNYCRYHGLHPDSLEAYQASIDAGNHTCSITGTGHRWLQGSEYIAKVLPEYFVTNPKPHPGYDVEVCKNCLARKDFRTASYRYLSTDLVNNWRYK